MTMTGETAGIPVLVTTEHRGVFFGWLEGDHTAAKTVRITQAQMAIYWSAEVRGVFGLAANGPVPGCKIGPAVPAMTLHGVTAITEVSEKAVAQWQKLS